MEKHIIIVDCNNREVIGNNMGFVQRRGWLILAVIMLGMLLCGCSTSEKETDFIHVEVETMSPVAPESSGDKDVGEATENSNSIEPVGEYNIQTVLDELEEQSNQMDKKIDQDVSLSQGDMNRLSYEIYLLWDDELNNIWGRLKEVLSEDEMSALTVEEREWITYKETEVEKRTEIFSGGSVRPLAMNTIAKELTRDRVYELAMYLGEKTGQSVTKPVIGYYCFYVDTQGTDDIFSELELRYQEKGVYDATIGLYRLTTLEGTVRVEDNKLTFEDEVMQVKGEIFFRDGGAVFQATESEFPYIEPGEEFVFPQER